MNAKNKNDSNFSQDGGGFDSQFGNSAFGAPSNSQFGGAGGNSQFGQSGAGGGAGGGAEFGSGFGGGTNAVSQIFKDSNFGDDERKKRMMMLGGAGVVALIFVGAVWFMFFRAEEMPVAEVAPDALATPAGGDAALGGLAENAAPAVEAAPQEATLPEDTAPAVAAPAAAVASTSYTYNEEEGGPVVNAADGAMIEVSRTQGFADRYVMGPVKGGSFRIPNPPPGKVYWREANSQTVNEISIAPAASIGLDFSAPAQAAAGAALSWSATGKVSFYRVEVGSDKDFSQIVNVVSTTQTQAVLNGVSAGNYFIRVGGFNLAAGKWEWSKASPIAVQ